MTPDSEESEWVEREILLAQREGKPIFPLLLSGQENPLLITTHYVDVTDGRLPPGEFYERLAHTAPARSRAESVVEPRQPFEPELIAIPAGEFLMGSDPSKDKDAQEREQPQHTLHLPEYFIATTPATNAQYLAFVEATDREPQKHWEGGKPPGGKEHHPVVNVSWNDAVAYCLWLGEVTGKAYRLPSEAEWEKAARGGLRLGREENPYPDRIYPWGNQWDEKRCNSLEGGAGDTTPVGEYPPGGDSPYGCVDMAGNVREWTRSLLKDYRYDPEDGREDPKAKGTRMLRGGGFSSSQGGVRCAVRNWYYQSYRDGALGFRVVVAPGL
jgi:formylglycine-generating enzyme required for sulfatase activity